MFGKRLRAECPYRAEESASSPSPTRQVKGLLAPRTLDLILACGDLPLDCLGSLGERTDADAYVRIARRRYRLVRTHEWSHDIAERLWREIG